MLNKQGTVTSIKVITAAAAYSVTDSTTDYYIIITYTSESFVYKRLNFVHRTIYMNIFPKAARTQATTED